VKPVTCSLQEDLSPEEAASFDRFVEAAPYTSRTQRTCWAKIAPRRVDSTFAFLTCREGDELTVAGLVRLGRLAPGRYVARFPRGPVFYDLEHFDRALPGILECLRKAGVATALMNPRWEEDDARRVEEVMRSHGLRRANKKEETSHRVTGIVSLEGTEEEIFASFEKRCQRDIKRAAKKGLIVRPAETEQEASIAQGRRKELARLRHMDDLGQPDLVDQWRSFKEDEHGVLLVAEAEGQIIGALAVVREGERAIIAGGGTVPVLPKLPRTHSLIWESMKIMKAAGCTRYDLAGMPEDEDMDEGERKRQFFKLAFSPTIVRLVHTHVGVLRPVEHALFFTLRRQLASSGLRRLLAPLLLRK